MRKKRKPLLFLPFAPAVVGMVGLAAALVIGWVGVGHLRAQSDAAAALRSKVLSRALAQRLRATAPANHADIVERAASRSGAEVLLVDYGGNIVVDGSLAPPKRNRVVQLLLDGEGEIATRLGRTRYAASPLPPPLQHLSVITFVRAPEAPFAMASLINSVSIFAALLIGAAAALAYTLARDVHADLAYLRERIAGMASQEAQPAGNPIPVLAIDQTGLLTSAFNLLIERYGAAETAYRRDLAGALAYDRDRSAFLAALSHELRTPLNSILGFADVLLSEAEGPLTDEARENLEVVHSSGQHLRSLIDDILALSALESGQMRLERQETNVFAIAADVVREAKIAAQNKNLVVQLAGQPTNAWADPLRTRQILSNIVGNAVKFTDQGSVLVFVQGTEEHVVISVTDTGPGIPVEQQEAIFEEYRQAGDAASRRKGSGLGLAITRRLVRMHGGTVKLESAVDCGARFTIMLPRRAPALDSQRPSDAPDSGDPDDPRGTMPSINLEPPQ